MTFIPVFPFTYSDYLLDNSSSPSEENLLRSGAVYLLLFFLRQERPWLSVSNKQVEGFPDTIFPSASVSVPN